jgi:hypothetical protein
MINEISSKGDVYKQYRKTKCSVCGTKEDLTVHHVVPQEILKLANVNTISTNMLETVCDSCHKQYTVIETEVKSNFSSGATPRVFNTIQSKIDSFNTGSVKPENIKKILLELSMFFHKDVKADEVKALSVSKRNFMDAVEYDKMKTFWKSHFKAWKAEQKLIGDITNFFK